MKNMKNFEKFVNESSLVEVDTVLATLLSEADCIENVECEIDGEIKTMNEYRILVEPDSDTEKQLRKLLYG